MNLQFKTKNLKQIKAVECWIDSITEEILYGGAKGGGKSFLGASLIFGDALIYPETHYFIARQELIDLTNYTIPTIQEVFQKWQIPITEYANYNGQNHVYTLYNGSKVFLIPCKESPTDPMYERFGSMQMTRGWIEEGGEVAEAAKANLWLSVGRWKNDIYGLKKKLLITANPKKGWMKNEFVIPYKKGELPVSKQFIQAYATDNLYLDPDYIKTLSDEKDLVRRQRLFEGNWDYDEDKDSLIDSTALTDTFSNTITKDNKKYLIVDVARFGKDSTVLTYWDGLEIYKVNKYQKQSIPETIQRIKDEASKEGIPYSNILIDEDGVGGGVVDGLFGVNGFVARSSPMPTTTQIRLRQQKIENHLIPKTLFDCLKSQCGYKLAEYINERKIAFKAQEYREEIIADLSALLRKKKVDDDKKLSLKSKDDIKKELGRSPDIGDTIIYRMWFEIKNDAQTNTAQSETVINLQNNKFITNKLNQSLNSNK